jgi:hypothetical protein
VVIPGFKERFASPRLKEIAQKSEKKQSDKEIKVDLVDVLDKEIKGPEPAI